MKIDVSVSEVVELFKEIQKTPEKLFEMMNRPLILPMTGHSKKI